MVPIWTTGGSFQGATYCLSDDTYYTSASGVVNSFNFSDGSIIQSGALSATPINGAYVCDYGGNLFYSFAGGGGPFQIEQIFNNSVASISQTFPGTTTNGMAYSAKAPFVATTSPLTTAQLTTNGLTTGLVPVPTEGVFVATAGVTPAHTVNVIPYQELYTTYFSIMITGVNNTNPIGIWHNTAFSQNFMFYVNPGDNKIWYADFTTGLSSSYSDVPVNMTFPSLPSFAMTSNGTVYCKSFSVLISINK